MLDGWRHDSSYWPGTLSVLVHGTEKDIQAQLVLSRRYHHWWWCLLILVPLTVLSHRYEDQNRKASDMYSFAIMLWELATMQVPFGDVPAMAVGLKVIFCLFACYCKQNCCIQIAKEHWRPLIPQGTNHHFSRIIEICWNADALKRPKFESIAPILDQVRL